MGAGQAGGNSVSPAFPDFVETDIPKDVFLTKITCNGRRKQRVQPSRAFCGPIQPFATQNDACAVARLLDKNLPVDIQAGFLTSDSRADSLPEASINPALHKLTERFEVLVLGFDHTTDLWAFCLNPPISLRYFPNHPHPRSDRELFWEGQTLHGLCVYSAAEFSLSSFPCPLTEFLRQVSIYLAKHILWLASRPKKWLGKIAINGDAHLSLEPNGPCWCGDGARYKHCCLPGEALRVLRQVRGLTVPSGITIKAK